jgi:DNA-binding GntR family transcriptional regulator
MTAATDLLSRHKAYSEIRGLILDGVLTPEEPLSERSLAELLNLGRMPIREAMQALAADGLLKIIPTRGTFVHRLSIDEIRDLYEVRQANEGLAAYLAARKGPMPKLQAFRGNFEQTADSDDPAELISSQKIGMDFHETIAEQSGNAELARFLLRIRDKVALSLRMAVEHDLDRLRQSAREHLDILGAIERSDPEAARQSMVDHLAHGFETRLRILGGIAMRGPR